MARNLTVTGIAHPYWTVRRGNGVRFATWLNRRSHAAPFLRMIAPRHEERIGNPLLRAATAFERETGLLRELAAALPPEDEAAHWKDDRIAIGRKLLLDAEAAHREGMEALAACVPDGLAAEVSATLALQDANECQRRIAHEHTLVAEAALATLVRLAPADLDTRLATLWESLPDTRKVAADGPIHRQLLFALTRLDSAVATKAIGRAVLFAGQGDDVPQAICRWAAEILWKRNGAAARDVYLQGLESPSPVVREVALPYVGRLADPALLPRLKDFTGPGATLARALLGDASAVTGLFDALSGPNWHPAYQGLIELGPRIEKEARSRLEAGPSAPTPLTALVVILSRIGSRESLDAVRNAATAHPAIDRLRQAVAEMEQRLGN